MRGTEYLDSIRDGRRVYVGGDARIVVERAERQAEIFRDLALGQSRHVDW
jgi:hypothetical protein